MAEAHFSGHTSSDTLEEFDELMDCGPSGSRSRSEALRESIELTIVLKRSLRATGIEFDSPREERFAVAEAVRRLAYEDGGRA